MGFTDRLARLQFGGRLFVDEWACSLHMVQQAGGTLPALGAIEPIMRTWFNTLPKMNSGARLSYLKFNEVAPITGRYLQTDQSNDLVLIPEESNPSPFFVAPQLSQSMSLGTAASRGRGHRGRFYPPAAPAQVDVTGRLDPIVGLEMATVTAQMIRDLSALQAGCFVAVWSKLLQLPHKVTFVEAGVVVDTQRRRRNSLDENYQRAATV